MVINLCLPHFQTTVQCNKLCADGYDVTNLLSADPAVRRRGFKLEYFLRPPVQVTLQFAFKVEVCRVDVELWPWGMDRGQACKRLEISTSSDPLLPQTHNPEQGLRTGLRQAQEKGQPWDQQSQEQHIQQGHKPAQSKGHQWSRHAQQWGQQSQDQAQQRSQTQGQRWNQQCGHAQGDTDARQFCLVGRCELREEALVCFSHPRSRSRPPCPSPAPPPPPRSRQEELWSRGPLSLGSVTQLRVTVPFGGSASAMGLKALAVWGLPARCCSPEELERVSRAHRDYNASLRPPPTQPSLPPSASQHSPVNHPPRTLTTSSLTSVPEDFLDPLTQEVMSLPMLLPSGASVDNATLEEYEKREATWGRAPNDPFTGVPFTSDSQPLPNPHLKSRIDRFILQAGAGLREGVIGRQEGQDTPHPSRLLAQQGEGQSGDCPGPGGPGDPGGDGGGSGANIESASHQGALCGNSGTFTQTLQQKAISGNTQRDRQQLTQSKGSGSGGSRAENGNDGSKFHPGRREERPHAQDQGPRFGCGRKRELGGDTDTAQPKAASARGGHSDEQLPESKRPRTHATSATNSTVPSGSSHEQRLTASLDQALLSALQGRPSFTSSASPSNQHRQTADTPEPPAGESRCGLCSCSLSVYSTSLSAYRLPCGHFLCRPCLHRKSRPPDCVTTASPNRFLCPTCRDPASSSDITRVHH